MIPVKEQFPGHGRRLALDKKEAVALSKKTHNATASLAFYVS